MIPYETIISEIFTFERPILELLLWLSHVKGKPHTVVYINRRFVGVRGVVTVAFREGDGVGCSGLKHLESGRAQASWQSNYVSLFFGTFFGKTWFWLQEFEVQPSKLQELRLRNRYGYHFCVPEGRVIR